MGTKGCISGISAPVLEAALAGSCGRFFVVKNDELETLTRAKDVLSTTIQAIRIAVIEGPDSGQSVVVSPETPMRIHVGTAALSDLRLADREVSRRHLAIDCVEHRFRITDLDSTNGTRINGVLIEAAYVAPGDVVSCGSTKLAITSENVEQEALSSAMGFGRMVGASEPMRRLYPVFERLAVSSAPVLIEGERGTGKELLGESFHEASRRPGPWTAVDCSVNPSLGRDLFGEGERPGLFELTSGGTVFLDEIAELPAEHQGSLLRVLDRGEVRRIGDVTARRVDVRVLASTCRNLEREVQVGRFREDLLLVMAAMRVTLPPLRERKGDVRLLARHFTEMFDKPPLPDAVLASMDDAPWPGNLRELRNAVMRHVTLGDVFLPTHSMAPPAGSDPDAINFDEPFPVARKRALAAFERRYITHLLEKNDGNVLRAAAHSGVALRYFQQVKARHGVGREPSAEG